MEPKEVLAVLSDANKALFETEVIGCEVYKSEDGGKILEEDKSELY